MDFTIPTFVSGVWNLIDPENIPRDAAQDSTNFVTQDGRAVLIPGRELKGSAGVVGGTTGFHKGYRVDGTPVFYVKRGTKIAYWDGSDWTDIITDLVATDEYTFANYASLAGAFTYINGPTAYYKVVSANPTSPINVYDSTKNFYGYITIDKGRTLLWNRDRDKTGLYGSYIDRQNSTVYTTVAGEAVGALGSTTYTGTLAFKAGGVRRSCFGVSIAGAVVAGTETFSDNFNGVLTSNYGGTGTINYATGAYSVTFSDVTTGAVTTGYQWEDSSVHGVTDFSKSATRAAGEGFVFPQDEGGDAILNVLIGQDGAYYSMKSRSAYTLSIDADDLGATNEVYRKEMGLPHFRAAISTNKGIFFVNTVNPTKPEVTILQRDKTSMAIEPIVLFKHFKFSDFEYDSASISGYDRWMMIFCRTPDSTTNNRILMCNLDSKTVDIVTYSGMQSIQDGQNLYVADSVTTSVYTIFSGFDDLQSPIDAYWIGRDEMLGTDTLKKNRRLRFKGRIDPDQSVEVFINVDEAGFQQVGTIVGSASYVNLSDSQSIGGNFIGSAQIGGSDTANAFGYFMELKARTGKYRKLAIKLVPTGIGYFDFDTITFFDVLLFEGRMPKASRQKQNVSLDGLNTDQ